MFPLLLPGIALVLWSLFIITVYYSTYYSSVDHIHVDYISSLFIDGKGFFGSPFGIYLTVMFFIYGTYKIWNISQKKKTVSFGIGSILGFFFLHLLVLCGIYASIPEGQQMIFSNLGQSSSLALFFHVVILLLYPVFLIVLMRSLGYSILSRLLKKWGEYDVRITVMAETTIGFFVFSTLLLCIASIGWYTLTGLIGVLLGLSLISWTGWKKTWHDLKAFRVTFENHTKNKGFLSTFAPRLLSAEFSFWILTLMMGVALISVIRPMPIGWDDLGVYMNYPKIMALTNESIKGAGMYAWQLITGTGFLFHYTAAQAFYINEIGSILAVIAIILGLSYLFDQGGKKQIIALPIILATVYYVMPMTVFHHSKDMKLDPALLFVSITGLMTFLALLRKKVLKSSNETFSLMLLVGILVGFAFSIKVTTIMLLLSIAGLLAYRLLSFWGFLGFFFYFLAIFTGGHLWSIMNVWMPNDSTLTLGITGALFLIGTLSFGLAIWKEGAKHLKEYAIAILILLVGFFIGISPWVIKNTMETQPWNAPQTDTKALILQSVLSGSGNGYQPDMTKIMSKEEYEKKFAELSTVGITSDGQSQNEDLGRYFGYENGINNYLRLPMNLTFQKNQGGEFTAITFIFLALIPPLFLFARGKKKWVYGSIVSVALLFFFIYGFMSSSAGATGDTVNPIHEMRDDIGRIVTENISIRDASNNPITITSTYISDIWNLMIKKPTLDVLSNITLGDSFAKFLSLESIGKYPLLIGYLILLVINIAIISVIHFLSRDEEEDTHFREIIVLLSVYGFLFLVSAFGIVWYGILVYYLFFALIGILSERFVALSTSDEKDEDVSLIKIGLALFLFFIIGLYWVRTSIPHAWSNLRMGGFNEYKYNLLDQDTTLFAYRSDYFVPIATMNLKDSRSLMENLPQVQSKEIQNILSNFSSEKTALLEAFNQIILQATKSTTPSLQADANTLSKYVYSHVLYPKKDEANTGAIYRIGTFMTYLINQNTTRYYDDSLIFGFDTYFYDQNPEVTIEKMKKLGFTFLLTDLNAATIDRDPRHALTKRYEDLLLTMRAKNLTLVDTDNTCLRFAIDEYHNGNLQTPEEFIDIAGTNYESYRENGSGKTLTITRGQKQQKCYNAMIRSIYQDNGADKYSYLAPIKEAIDSNDALKNTSLLSQIMASIGGTSYFALFEINDAPENTETSTQSDTLQ